MSPAVPPLPDTATDLRRWRLRVDDGRQWWDYLSESAAAANPLSDCDRHHLSLLPPTDSPLPSPVTVFDSVRNAFRYLARTQTADGHWACQYDGPMFLIPGLVFVWYITGRRSDILPDPVRIELVRYLRSRECITAGGGWGIHIESPPTVFGTALNYIAIRLLGVPANDPVASRARSWLHSRTQHGVLGIPSWGKVWLATLGLYSWDGIIPIPPEAWLLPLWFPAHPWRMWVHTRMVYLPMGFLYGHRFTYPGDDLIHQLKLELYPSIPFELINWPAQPFVVDDIDRYVPQSRIGKLVWWLIGKYESIHLKSLRRRALRLCLELVHNEDDNTMSLDLGPVNKALNMLVVYYADGPDSQRFKDHIATIRDFLWMSCDGMMMNGTNGVQLWDTAFVAQAGYEAGLHSDPEFRPMFQRSLDFLDRCQIRHNAPFQTYRHTCKGAWPFSNRQQSYTVSDTTAEGLKAVLQLQSTLGTQLVSPDRLRNAVDVLLSMPNGDGGFGSYELVRGPKLLEFLNPAEVFGNIMIEYTYPECTTSSVLGLLAYQKYMGDGYRAREVDDVIQHALTYIRRSQEPHTGGWYGSWGVCYTYATWFSVEALVSAGGLSYDTSPEIRRACDFIASKQMDDGGWGERYKSCEMRAYIQHAESQVVNTSWAVLLLMKAKYPIETVIRRGIELILTRQQINGSWRQEAIEGVFNKNCTISYPNYKLYFTTWALARFSKFYGNPTITRLPDNTVCIDTEKRFSSQADNLVSKSDGNAELPEIANAAM